jgi:hypothetical protein
MGLFIFTNVNNATLSGRELYGRKRRSQDICAIKHLGKYMSLTTLFKPHVYVCLHICVSFSCQCSIKGGPFALLQSVIILLSCRPHRP